MRIVLAAVAAALVLPAPAAALEDGLARTPPMGWSSWNRFGCGIDERTVRETADALVASGMREAGYRYVNVDDCWMAPARDGSGRLQADPLRFPSGILALAAYVHARGLRLGLYTSIGARTCQGLPGLAGHERDDLERIAGWGADYLKVDFCGADDAVRKDPAGAYARVRDGLAAGGRKLVLAICTWGRGRPWTWGPRVGHMWRVSGDIRPTWRSVLHNARRSLGHAAGPGGWNDPDSLEVGNRGLTAREERAHLGLWAMLAAPLIAGNDVRNMSRTTRRILLNRELIAVDQDRLGAPARRLRRGRHEVWRRRLAGGARGVLLLNRGRRTAVLRYRLGGRRGYRVRDLWRHRWRTSGPVLRAHVRGHAAALFRIPR